MLSSLHKFLELEPCSGPAGPIRGPMLVITPSDCKRMLGRLCLTASVFQLSDGTTVAEEISEPVGPIDCAFSGVFPDNKLMMESR